MNPPETLTWPVFLEETLLEQPLDASSLRWAFEQVMSSQATPAQIGAFLMAMRARGATGADLATLVDVMVEHAAVVEVDGVTVDTCGTGGDNMGSVNISTMAAIVVAACGERVVKHGNRAASSQSGSADVLEALGVAITVPADRIGTCVDRASIAFCFAQAFHPSMRFAGPVRKDLGIRTVFNVLGPLSNPAKPAAQVVGVADPTIAPVVAEALALRGTSAIVVRGDDGLDEVTTADRTHVWDCRGGEVRESTIDVTEFGIPRAPLSALAGGDAAHNAAIARSVLQATSDPELEPIRNAVAINAAVALAAVAYAKAPADPAPNLADELAGHLRRAREALDSGATAKILDTWIEVAADLAGE